MRTQGKIIENYIEKNRCLIVGKACRRGTLIKNETSQTFEREGLETRIDGIPSLVCDHCGQAYYPPGIGDKISAAANHLFMLSEFKHTDEFIASI